MRSVKFQGHHTESSAVGVCLLVCMCVCFIRSLIELCFLQFSAPILRWINACVCFMNFGYLYELYRAFIVGTFVL